MSDLNRRYLDNPLNLRRRAEDAAVVTPAPPEPYPAARYHQETGVSCLVADEAADEALGDKWGKTMPTLVATIPGYRYHATKPAKFVDSQAEADALGPDWYPTVAAAAESASK